MCLDDFNVYIRDNRSLKKVKQLFKFRELVVVKKKNQPGSFALTIDANCDDFPMQYANEAFGIYITRSGSFFFSGRFTRFKRSGGKGKQRILEITGSDDFGYIADKLALPSPYRFQTTYSTPFVTYTNQLPTTILWDALQNNMYNSNVPSRKLPFVTEFATLPSISGLQPISSYTYRFPPLMQVVKDMMVYITNLGYDLKVTQVNNKVRFQLVPYTNHYKNKTGVVFSPNVGNIVGYEYTYEKPEWNMVLVGGGQSGGTTPEFRRFGLSGNEYSRSRWGPDIEHFIDKRGITDFNELGVQANLALKLPPDGKEYADRNMYGKISVQIEIDEGRYKYGTHWKEGDFIHAILEYDNKGNIAVEVLDYIQEVTTTLSPESGYTISAKVGSDDAIRTNKGAIPFITDTFAHIKERLYQLEAGGY